MHTKSKPTLNPDPAMALHKLSNEDCNKYTEFASLKGHSLFSVTTLRPHPLKYDHIFTPREENDFINLDVTFLYNVWKLSLFHLHSF